jgi:alanine racemase
LNSGLNRTGLGFKDVFILGNMKGIFESFNISYIMTHLASSKIPNDPYNDEQLLKFNSMASLLPPAPLSIADSGSLLLGPKFYGDMVRCGGNVFGVTPKAVDQGVMGPTFQIHSKIVQILEVDSGQTVGYQQTYQTTRPTRLATIEFGYGDGYPRTLSNIGIMAIGGKRVPVAGRVSMDLTTLDITDLDPSNVHVGDWVEVVGPHIPFKELMGLIESNGYEFLTHLGPRVHRLYKDA